MEETQVQLLIKGDTVTMSLARFVDLLFPLIAERMGEELAISVRAPSVSLPVNVKLDTEQLAKVLLP